ncbi:MAG: helix-turn-helix domain-containing protein [Janthinobacterium lividum]
MPVLRRTIGDVLRDERRGQQRTLREVSSTARVSLGYLSEVERGQKEASSELLASICTALAVPLSHVLGEVTRRLADEEGVRRPFVSEGPFAAEGIVPIPLAPRGPVDTVAPFEPVLETPVPATATPVDSDVESIVDHAVDAIVDSALEDFAVEASREFAVELAGLPDELELILRRRLVSAA